MKKIAIGIVGAAGYTGGELLRILLWHPSVDIIWANSSSQAGKPVSNTHTDLIGETDLIFSNETDFSTVELIFLCSGHGQSKKFLEENVIPDHLKIIDLSTDFRDQSFGFTYGLPELQKEKIKLSKRVANPGCFATAIQLALLPLAKGGLLKNEVHVSAITGSTGAGQALSSNTHFSWRSNNISVYKAFSHQHLAEIKQSLKSLQNTFEQDINFIPFRGNFTRGILAQVYTYYEGTIADAEKLYTEFYQDAPFTHVINQPLDLKMVVNTNKCLLELQKHGNKLLIGSAIDNLTKGASGQAVQNMNLMYNLPESTGLNFKNPAF